MADAVDLIAGLTPTANQGPVRPFLQSNPLASPDLIAGLVPAPQTDSVRSLSKASPSSLTELLSTPKGVVGMGAASAALGLGAGLIDLKEQGKNARAEQLANFEMSSGIQAGRAEQAAVQSEAAFEQAKELGGLQHIQNLEIQQDRFEFAMDQLADRFGFQKEVLMQDAQLAKTVSLIAETDMLLAGTRAVEQQNVDDNTQQFFRDPRTGARI